MTWSIVVNVIINQHNLLLNARKKVNSLRSTGHYHQGIIKNTYWHLHIVSTTQIFLSLRSSQKVTRSKIHQWKILKLKYFTFEETVYNNYPQYPKILAVVDRWSLIRVKKVTLQKWSLQAGGCQHRIDSMTSGLK